MHGLEGQIDYINAHGTSTPAGDIQELNALRTVFGEQAPVIGSTKSLSGHSLGAAGVQEAIYSLLMMQDDFIAASANIETLDEGAEGMPIAMARVDKAGLQQVMSNSLGSVVPTPHSFSDAIRTDSPRCAALAHRADSGITSTQSPSATVVPGAMTARPPASLRLVMTPELWLPVSVAQASPEPVKRTRRNSSRVPGRVMENAALTGKRCIGEGCPP